MKTERVPLFCDTALAERIERAEAHLVAGANQAARARNADTAGFLIPVAGGVASFADEDSPFNNLAGLGFAGVPSVADLDESENRSSHRGGGQGGNAPGKTGHAQPSSEAADPASDDRGMPELPHNPVEDAIDGLVPPGGARAGQP